MKHHTDSVNTARTLSARAWRRAAAVTAFAAVLAGAGVAVPSGPARAASVFTELRFSHDVNTWNVNPALCDDGPMVRQRPEATTPAENTSASAVLSQKQNFSSKTVEDDTLWLDVSQKSTTRARAAAGLPIDVRLDFSGKGSAVSKQATSECLGSASATSTTNFTFRTAVALWATLSYTKTGTSYAEAYISSTDDGIRPYEDLYGYGFKGSGSTTVLLPPGEYEGYVVGQTPVSETHVSKSVTAAGTVGISFAKVGSATRAPSGAARSLISLSSARNCAARTLPARLPTSSKSIKTMSRVNFSVNGKIVKSLKGRQVKRGLAVTLPIRDDVAASVLVTVKLKNGKSRTVSAGYRACA